jgi:hypothetical protein
MITSKEWEIGQVLDAAKTTWWAFSILIQELNVIEVLFYVNILQCFFAVEHITANAVSIAIGDNGNRLIFEIWWNFFYDLFSIKNVALPVNYLKDLRDFGLDKGGVDPFSPKYRLSSIICDVASFRLFKPVRSTLISLHPGLDRFPTPLMLSLQP